MSVFGYPGERWVRPLVTRYLRSAVLPRIESARALGPDWQMTQLVSHKRRGTVFRCVNESADLGVKIAGPRPRANQSIANETAALRRAVEADPQQTRLAVTPLVLELPLERAFVTEWIDRPTLQSVFMNAGREERDRAQREALRWLAGFHAIAPRASAAPPADKHLEALRASLRRQGHRLAAAERQAVRCVEARLTALSGSLARVLVPRTLRHGDANGDNFLWDAGRIVGLDLSDAIVGDPVLDLAQLLVDAAIHRPPEDGTIGPLWCVDPASLVDAQDAGLAEGSAFSERLGFYLALTTALRLLHQRSLGAVAQDKADRLAALLTAGEASAR